MSQGLEEIFGFLSLAMTLSMSILYFEGISSNSGLPSESIIPNTERDGFSNSKDWLFLMA